MEKLSPKYNPLTGFICLCESGSNVNPGPVIQEKIKLELGDSVFKVFYSDDCQVCENNGITAILWGNLFHGTHPDSIPVLYSKYGEETGRHLSGFYAVLILDRFMKRAVIISDRMSSKPLYFSKWNNSWIVSTSFLQLTRYLPAEPSLDIAGVSWYLSNGAIHNSHTLFRNVIRLERATLYSGNGHSFTAHEYWNFHFMHVPEYKDERAIIKKMKEVLTAAVADCLPRYEPVYLSLSGGYDSSGILGVLRYNLNQKDVRTFSYGLNEDNPSSDPPIARKLSEIAGYDHFFLYSYNNDFKNTLELNALWGDGISHFCDEVYAWLRLKMLNKGYRPTCLFGDTTFIFYRKLIQQLSDQEDALEAIMIRDAGHIPWLKQYMPSDDFNRIANELSQGCQRLVDKAKKAINDMQFFVNYLRIEGRARNVLIPWRVNFCSKAFIAMDPWYHDDCLEFQNSIPRESRVERELFIKAVKELAPDLYQSERARVMGYVPDWKGEITRNYKMILEEYIYGKSCYKLENIISPESIISMIENEIILKQLPAKKYPLNSLFKNIPLLKKSPKAHSPARKILPPEKFILRYLVLKRTLEIIQEMRARNS